MTIYRPENIINKYVWEQFKTKTLTKSIPSVVTVFSENS